MSDKPEWMPSDASPDERRLLLERVSKGSEIASIPEIPDAPDISTPALAPEGPATDAEFFIGRRYRPHGRKSRSGATFEIVEHSKEPQHLAFDAERKVRAEKRGLDPPAASFYVVSPRGTVGWVPWVGSVIAWPWEAAWEADLVEAGAPDPKPERKK